jgi:four helix bundle protein
MEGYRELEVWQKSFNLVTKIYKLTGRLPKQEQYGLASQIQRSAVSIPSNIAEGWGRGKTREYIQFLQVARGSLMELETHLVIAQKPNYIKPENLSENQQEIESIGRMLNRLVQSLKKRLASSSITNP